jgi:hypothetical protein
MTYWSKCEKCPQKVASPRPVLCRFCQTGKTRTFVGKIPAIIDSSYIWELMKQNRQDDVVVCQFKGRDVTYGEILSVDAANGAVTRIHLKNGNTLVFSLGFNYEEV